MNHSLYSADRSTQPQDSWSFALVASVASGVPWHLARTAYGRATRRRTR